MDENSAALSQDAIDALLNAQSEDDDDAAPAAAAPEPVAEAPAADADAPGPAPVDAAPEPAPVAAAPAAPPPAPVAAPPPPAAPTPVTVAAPPPPGVTPPPGVVYAPPPAAAPVAAGVDEERAMIIAGEAAESAITPLQGDLDIISGRVSTLEEAVKKIASLEAEVARLKAQKPAAAAGGITIEQLKPLVDRLAKLEKAAKGSPVFNLYEKFVCSSCASHGAAQVKARCGACGKEGWFGKKTPD